MAPGDPVPAERKIGEFRNLLPWFRGFLAAGGDGDIFAVRGVLFALVILAAPIVLLVMRLIRLTEVLPVWLVATAAPVGAALLLAALTPLARKYWRWRDRRTVIYQSHPED
jgi:hypothetical protein